MNLPLLRNCLVIGLLWLPLHGHGDCQKLNFGSVSSNVSWQGGSGLFAGNYDPFDLVAYAQQVQFTVSKKSGDCTYFVAFSPSDSSGNFNRQLDKQGARLNYNLYQEASLSTVLKDANSNEQSVIAASFSSNQTQQQHFYFFNISPEQLSTNGRFTDTVTLALYQGSFADHPVESSSKMVQFNATVPSLVDASLVNSGAGFSSGQTLRNANFGLLEQGEQQNFDLLIRYNRGYRLLFESVNFGVLQQQNGNASITYELNVDGASYDLSGGNARSFSDQRHPGLEGEGDRLALEIVITGQPQGKPNGTYSDTITAIITAK